MKALTLVYFNAGGGHRAAAQALQEAIARQGRPWAVRLVNLVEVLDPNGVFRKLTGMAPEDLYNKRLARGWTLGLAQELKLLQAMIRLGHASLVKPLQQHWLATEPDLVVSLVPNFNRALFESLATTLPGVPYVTVLTDLADHPPHFWIEDQPQHFVCGSDRAVQQALAAGHPPERVHRARGMILRAAFHEPPAADREAGLRALGLDPSKPTGLVLFGGTGSARMLGIARALADRQLILLCGHNAALAGRLRALAPGAPHAVLGFTPEVGRLMRLADYFIGKPGPGSLSEAVQCGLPVITTLNRWTLPQERYNAQWVRDHGLGRVLPSLGGIGPAVGELLQQLPQYRAAVARVENRAVFDVVDHLSRLVDGATLDPPHQQQDDENDEEQPHDAAGGVAPAAAVRPGREGADQQQDQHDGQDEGQRHGVFLGESW